jgi:hypothetical protein
MMFLEQAARQKILAHGDITAPLRRPVTP